MKRPLFFISFILYFSLAFSQQTGKKAYYIEFTDKKDSPYSISEPLDFLSQRALDRREKHNVDVSEQDFPVNPWYLDSLRVRDAKILFTSRWLNAATVQVDTELVITKIMELPFVKKTERVYRSNTDNTKMVFQQELSMLSPQDGKNYYGLAFRQIEMLNGHKLHEMGYSGQGVLVAVLDGGFFKVDKLSAYKHLFDENRILATYDFVHLNDSVYEDITHGLYVLSAMAAKIPGQVVGTAPDADYILLKSENGESEFLIEEDAWVAAAEFADSCGADVINASLGYSTFNDPDMNHTYEDMDGNTARSTIGADIASSKGILVVNSAGNSGNDPWKYITAPADGDSVFTIGAVDEDVNYVAFSSTGPTYDGRIKPDVVAMGLNTVVTSTKDSVLSLVSGTSLSSPVMAGLIASLMSAFPEKTSFEIKDAIRKSAHLYTRPNNEMGYGLPDFYVAYQILKYSETDDVEDIELLEVYPNPFLNLVVVSFFSKKDQDITISITNNYGQLVFQKQMTLEKNQSYKENLDLLSQISNGVYIISIGNKDFSVKEKLLKL
jgi:serine protease AprX